MTTRILLIALCLVGCSKEEPAPPAPAPVATAQQPVNAKPVMKGVAVMKPTLPPHPPNEPATQPAVPASASASASK